jgi:hypothetical protein
MAIRPDRPNRYDASLGKSTRSIWTATGNAIDFYTHVLGVSFADAMRELIPSNTP